MLPAVDLDFRQAPGWRIVHVTIAELVVVGVGRIEERFLEVTQPTFLGGSECSNTWFLSKFGDKESIFQSQSRCTVLFYSLSVTLDINGGPRGLLALLPMDDDTLTRCSRWVRVPNCCVLYHTRKKKKTDVRLGCGM
uniref:Uncharacterized protein n=1 Tax=Anopheles atroparvus TaxID=41427 RepID=A0AAG5DJ62_ANOAO